MLFSDTDFEQFYECVKDLLASPQVCAMEKIPQHKAGISCLDHSVFVAYVSFRICRLFGWNYAAAARGRAAARPVPVRLAAKGQS